MDTELIQFHSTGTVSLKCMVGVNNNTKEMDCEGSWDKVQEMMKTKFDGTWDDMKVVKIDIKKR